jgi:mitochondrial fission protein ELM1
MRTQALGLAQAVAEVVVEKVLDSRRVYPWFRATLAAEGLEPPWPDVLISCGRRSAARAVAVRKASGGRTLAVHVQDPRIAPAAFDLVVAMAHDRIAEAPNVIKVGTALHDLTEANLAEAGAHWAERFARLGRPLIGVLIGGNVTGRAFTTADGRKLLDGVSRLRAATGGGLAITPSRRTPAPVRAMFAEALSRDPRVFLWDLEGANPYRGILALADRLVVTSDSVSMVSEAVAAPAPVEVFDLGFARHAGFLKSLEAKGLTRRFTGDLTPPAGALSVNATAEAAAAVRDLLRRRAQADPDRRAAPEPASPR